MTDSIISAREYFSKYNIGGSIFKNIVSSVKSGDNSLCQDIIAETLKSDFSWLDEVENTIFSLEKIVKFPQKSMIKLQEVVNVEKARKINSDSVRHLSANTNLIREIQSDGSVIPSKVLTPYFEEDIIIHENRFIFTLIGRLIDFLEARRSFIVENVGTFDTTKLNLTSQFKYGSANAELEVTLKVKKPSGMAESYTSDSVLVRIDTLLQRVKILKGSDFYKALSVTKPLVPPIAKTNLLIKHKDYSVCYKLWLFISSFTSVGYSVSLTQEELNINDEYFDDLTYIIAMTLKVVMQNVEGNDALSNEKFEPQPEKIFNHIIDFNYIPEFKDDLNGDENDYVNDFYYKKIKEILEVEQFLSRTEDESTPSSNTYNIFMPFTRFYRKLVTVNNKIFKEYLHFGLEENENVKDYGTIEYYRRKLENKEELVKRYELLEKLKTIDLKETVRSQININGEIEQLKQKIDNLATSK